MLNPIPHLPKKRTRKNIKARSCALTLSFALIFAPMLSLALPSSAFASSSNQTETYNKLFDSFIDDTQTYYIFAGNVGDATQLNTFSTGNANANNNTLYVSSGAGISVGNNFASGTAYSFKISGAAGHIALNGYGNTATATGNTALMDAKYDNSSLTDGGYIANLTGAYISINKYSYNKNNNDTYIKTTVDTVTASNNSAILKDGAVGYGLNVPATGVPQISADAGQYLTGAFVESSNNNGDAQFILNNNSVLIEGGFVSSKIGETLGNGSVAGAHVSTVTGNATMSGNSVTITGGDVKATTIAGAVFYGYTFEKTILGTNYADPDLYGMGGLYK